MVNIIYINHFFVFFIVKASFFYFVVVEIYAISTHFYTLQRKKGKLFYNNSGIRAIIIHFCFVLIDLINDYKKCLFLVVMLVWGFV